MKKIENIFFFLMLKLMYIMFTYDDNYVEKQKVATVRMLYTFAFYFAQKEHRVKKTRVVPMCVLFYPC